MASPLAGAPNTRKYSNFRRIRGLRLYLENGIVRGIFTVDDEYKVVCRISNSTAFDDMTSSDPDPQFQGHSIV